MAQSHLTAFGKTYRVNEDGSITYVNEGTVNNNVNNNNNNKNKNNNNSEKSGGCGWLSIAFIIVCGIIAYFLYDDSSADSDYEGTKTEGEATHVITAEDEIDWDDITDEDIVEDEYQASYLNVSDNDIVMGASGGTIHIDVYTDGKWYISVNTLSWGHVSTGYNSISLNIDPNTSAVTRTDWFQITAGSHTKRINIKQMGKESPPATINKVWVEHNIFNNGYKGMAIHVKFDINNMKAQTIFVYARFYNADNITPLHDPYGNNLSFYNYCVPSYDNTTFGDFKIFVPYLGLNMEPIPGTINLSFDISITDSAGKELTRKNNFQFTYTQ